MGAKTSQKIPHMGPIFVLFALAATCRVLVTLVDVFERTKAVQPAEFAAGEALFVSYPTLWGILIGLTVVISGALGFRAWTFRHASRVDFCLLSAAAVAQVVAVLDPLGTLLTGIALLAIFFRTELESLRRSAHRERLEHTLDLLSGLTFGRVMERLPGIAIWSLTGLLLFGSAEAYFATAPHAGELFTWGDFEAFLALGAAGIVLASLKWALEVALVSVAIGAFARGSASTLERMLYAAAAFGLTSSAWMTGLEFPLALILLFLFDRWCRGCREPLARFFAPGVLLGLYVGVRLQGHLFGVLIDEIVALGLVTVTYAALAPFAVLIAVWTHGGFRRLVERHAPQRLLEVGAAIALAFVVPPLAVWTGTLARGTQNLRQLIRRACIPAILALALATWFLGELSYPILYDFSEVAQPVWAALLGVCAAMLLLIFQAALLGVAPFGGRVTWLVVLLVSSVSMVVWWKLEDRHGPRLIASQHAKILRQTLDSVRLFHEDPDPSLRREDEIQGDPHGLLSKGPYPRLAEQAFYKTRRPPVFFVLWDAARGDHMSFNGYERKTTPNADRLARDGIVFEMAYANATATTVSVRHLFSGHYATRHMLTKEHAPFFTGALVEGGYDRMWLNVHGSDYNGVSAEAFVRNQPNEDLVKRACRFFPEYEEKLKTERVIALLDQELAERKAREHPADGLFFYLHCAAMHFPWSAWPDHPSYGERPEDLYDNCIGHADTALGVLIAALKERGIYDDAIIVLTADHGTGLQEHGKYGGFQPYEEQIRVPLLMKLPGFAPRRVKAPVALIDVAPTFLSLFEPGGANPFDGWSLLQLANGEAARLPRRYVVSLCAFEDALALIDLDTRYKLHLHRMERYAQLYDLNRDPMEQRNLADEERDVTDRLYAIAADFLLAGLDTYANPYHYRGWTSY